MWHQSVAQIVCSEPLRVLRLFLMTHGGNSSSLSIHATHAVALACMTKHIQSIIQSIGYDTGQQTGKAACDLSSSSMTQGNKEGKLLVV